VLELETPLLISACRFLMFRDYNYNKYVDLGFFIGLFG